MANGFASSCHTVDHGAREVFYAPYRAWLSVFPLEPGSVPVAIAPWYQSVFPVSEAAQLELCRVLGLSTQG